MREETQTHGVDMSDVELRDLMAANALTGLGTWEPPEDYLDADGYQLPNYSRARQRMVREARARWAYDQADAMLEARGGLTAREANAELARIDRVASKTADNLRNGCRHLGLSANDAETIIETAIVAIRLEMSRTA